MKVESFFREWTGTRPNLCTAFHEAGIEAMAFAEAYHKALQKEQEQANGVQSKDGKLPIPHVVGRSEQLCHCGKKEDSRYSPCCSLEHWHDKFS